MTRYNIYIGEYDQSYLPENIKILPSSLTLTPLEIDQEVIELVKSNKSTGEVNIFTNNPYVPLILSLIYKRYIVCKKYNIDMLDMEGINIGSLTMIQNNLVLENVYDLPTDNNMLNNQLVEYNYRFMDILELEEVHMDLYG